MEVNKPMDVSSFDWDDSALIEAYDRVWKSKKSKSKESKKTKKENAKEEKTKKHWGVGDYCRAIYHEDGISYEAMIVDIQGDSCTVEFLGYGDYTEVFINTLEDSLGKKARQKQRKSVKKPELNTCTSDTDYSYMNDSKDVNKATKSGPLPNGNITAEQYDHFNAGYTTQVPPANMQHAVPPQFTFNPAPPAPVQRVGGPASCLPPPPPPPMPSCSAAANDPTLSAMLMAWYMAGYYTGLHRNQKSPQCHKPHCCEHHIPNQCGHFF